MLMFTLISYYCLNVYKFLSNKLDKEMKYVLKSILISITLDQTNLITCSADKGIQKLTR